MKTHLKTWLSVCSIILLITAASSCKKNASEPTPTPEIKTANLTAKIDGKDVDIKQDAITSTLYATTGDAVKSLATTATLNAAGDKLAFFIDDLKSGNITITKKLGTSANPGNPKLTINGLAVNAVAVQSFVQYSSGGNAYYAYSGSLEITLTDTSLTMKWSITFKDASGREFTSAGTIFLPNFATVTKPKTEIVDPTPVAAKPTIENISPVKGYIGDTVAITGVNYSTTLAENVVKFNGVDATVLSATATKLTVKAPQAGTTGTISIKVKNSEVTTGPTFTYITPANITSIVPTSAKIADTVTVNGVSFSTVPAENKVLFGDNKLGTVISATATKLVVIVPAGATTASIQITVNNRTAISPLFTVVATPPPPVGANLSWQDLGALTPMADINQSASVGSKTLFTAGLNGNYLYLVNGTTVTNVYDNLPLNKSGLKLNLLISSGTAFYLTTSNGVVKSTNGETWINIAPNAGAPQQEFASILAQNDNVTLIKNNMLYTSTDGGTTFTSAQVSSQVAVIDYMLSDGPGKYWYGIDISRNNKDSNPKLYYRSTDKGKTWTQTSGRTGYFFFDAGYKELLKASGYTQFALYAPPSDTVTVRGQRLWKTVNQGDTWTKVSDEQVITVKTMGDYVMYATAASFYVANDGGTTFKQYAAPAGYVIGSIEKGGNYYYVFCSKIGSPDHKIFRALVVN
jgi:hypothetical protein